MKQWWVDQLVRVDALSLRERVFLFLSVLVCGLALVDALWLSPAQTVQKQLFQKFEAQSAELMRLRQDLLAAGQPVDASKAVREDIVAVSSRMDSVNRDIDALVPVTSGGPGLEQVLVQFLRRQDGLTLLGLGTLRSEPVTGNASANALPVGMTRKGIELRVTGPYPALVRYVKTLEAAMPALRWGSMQLKSEKQPPELTLQVFVVGVQAP